MAKTGPRGKWAAGHRTKYDNDKHPQAAYNVLSKGGTREMVCVDFSISDSTFCNWLEIHEELREAYDQGMIACKVYWQHYVENAVTDETINPNILRNVLLDRVGFTDKRKLRLEGLAGAKTKEDREKVFGKVMEGGITTSELKDITGASKDLQEMASLDKMQDDLSGIQAQLAGRNSEAENPAATQNNV